MKIAKSWINEVCFFMKTIPKSEKKVTMVTYFGKNRKFGSIKTTM